MPNKPNTKLQDLLKTEQNKLATLQGMLETLIRQKTCYPHPVKINIMFATKDMICTK